MSRACCRVRARAAADACSSSRALTRLVGQRLSERLGQPFVIENRSGADSNIATEAVVRATHFYREDERPLIVHSGGYPSSDCLQRQKILQFEMAGQPSLLAPPS
jgi:hypothetical protein